MGKIVRNKDGKLVYLYPYWLHQIKYGNTIHESVTFKNGEMNVNDETTN